MGAFIYSRIHISEWKHKEKDKEAHVLEEPERPVEPPLLTGSEKIGPHGFYSFVLRRTIVNVLVY